MMVRAHVFISGRVQGVFFREETRRLAKAQGVTGWVRNCTDGRVEAVFEGEELAVQRLLDWCHTGPPQARIQEVRIEREPPTGEFVGFDVRPTGPAAPANS